jgi:fatty-acyl-CoA synthase
MLSTMQDRQLTVPFLFHHGAEVHAGSQVASFDGDKVSATTFAELATRSRRFAAALRRLGIQPGDRVGTFCWNTSQHLEAYFAIPCLGAVLHLLNIRLFPDQLAYIVNHAADRIVVADASLVPVLAKAAPQFKTVERFVLIGNCDSEPLPAETLDYEELLSREEPASDFPEIDERSAAAMCYTSGTTGNPKGVVYSHRSIYLHSMGMAAPSAFGLNVYDRLLAAPSMFHANSWGLPHTAWMTGADLLFPGRYLQAAPLCRLIEEERPTVSAGVPTIWNDVLRYAESHPVDFSSLRLIVSAGSSVPRSLIEAFYYRHRVRIVQGWGMTETSPIVTIAHPPKDCPEGKEIDYYATAGRVIPGCELRITSDGAVMPNDGESIGEIEARGPWITRSYYGDDSGEKFHDGWLRTGDVGTLDARGYLQIKDRTKDVIKSGGEWVSSVELENAIMAHPDVIESAVIGVPDTRWDERPLACVVLKPGATTTAADLRVFLQGRVVKWWIPERWVFVDEIPKTSVGKFDKKVLRARQIAGELTLVDTTGA